MARLQKGISGRTRLLFSGAITTPDASKYATILDTTRRLPNEFGAVAGKSDALPTVPAEDNAAGFRGQALGRIYAFAVACTTNNVALLQYGLAGDGTWQQFATTTITAAAAPQAFTWDPSAYGFADILICVLAGGSAPGAVTVSITERTIP